MNERVRVNQGIKICVATEPAVEDGECIQLGECDGEGVDGCLVQRDILEAKMLYVGCEGDYIIYERVGEGFEPLATEELSNAGARFHLSIIQYFECYMTGVFKKMRQFINDHRLCSAGVAGVDKDGVKEVVTSGRNECMAEKRAAS